MKITFNKPVVLNGNEVKELIIGDVSTLTGRDILSAEKETRALGENSPILHLTNTFAAVIAAKLAKVPADDIIDLPANEFLTVVLNMQNELLGKGL
ncbi:MAG TPA: phage tail assembly protein [Methylomusa anaerophila]|uniref:Phage tail assembly protein n=1 Tax=Methylomusa anaerophila TaxID=1930071 RepID=A0A348AJ08_9FIRM|nr:phage tail assembly protein [Methylomusa anaerophila]BBB91056.1 hypothetical protein MAMMFC1_01724 [Methylomusa anaerophila]HML88930.1 phage tail assembly protein [Methylomusa anaerophila]